MIEWLVAIAWILFSGGLIGIVLSVLFDGMTDWPWDSDV